VKTGAERFKLTGNGKAGAYRLLRFTPDGGSLIALGDNFFLRKWDMKTGKLLAEYRTLPDGMTVEQLDDERQKLENLAFMPSSLSDDASTLAFARHKMVQLFDAATGEEKAKFEVDPNGVTSLALSPDGKRLAVSGRAKYVEIKIEGGGTRGTTEKDHITAVWDIGGKKKIWESTGSGGWGSTTQFSPDGTKVAERVAVGDEGSFILVQDAAQGKVLGRVAAKDFGWHFAFDRTGKKIVTSNNNTTVTLYDLDVALEPIPPK
jgi:WD40 repeat protein